VQASREVEAVERPIEAGFVVQLVGTQVRDHILHIPAAAVAGRPPSGRIEALKVAAEAPDLAVVAGKGIARSRIDPLRLCAGASDGRRLRARLQPERLPGLERSNGHGDVIARMEYE
jgi:hypothetical protein